MRLKGALKIDLPSEETYKVPGRIGGFFGKKTKPSGEERVVASVLSTIDQFIDGFEKSKINNAIILKIDDTLIYNDTEMVEDDVHRMIIALDDHRLILDDHFKMIHLVMEHKCNGIHYIFDVKIRGNVKKGEEEVYIVISGRVEELSQKEGEDAKAFRNRIKEISGTKGFFDGYKAQFDGFLEDVLENLKLSSFAVGASVEYTEIGIVKPKRESIKDMGKGGFKNRKPVFRNDSPTVNSPGYYHDPYSYYYYNPMDTFVTILLMNSLLCHTAYAYPPDTAIYNSGGQQIAEAGGIDDVQDQLSDVSDLATEGAADAIDTGSMDDIDMDSYDDVADMSSDAGAFDSGDSGYFDDGGAGYDDGGSSCSSCSSCASCSSCS